MYIFTGIGTSPNTFKYYDAAFFIDVKSNYHVSKRFRDLLFFSIIDKLSDEQLISLLVKNKYLIPFDICGTSKDPNSKLFCMRKPNHAGIYCMCYTNSKRFRWPRNDDQLSLFGRRQWWTASISLSLEFSSTYRPKRKIPNNFGPNYWEYDRV